MKTARENKLIALIVMIGLLLSIFPGTATAFAADDRNAAGDELVYYFLGSSVTLGVGNDNTSFVDYIFEAHPNWVCVKEAVSGTTLVDSDERSYISRMRDRINADENINHFICQLSTNDASKDLPLGEIINSKELEDFDTSTIIGAVEYIICYVQQTWDCPISFYTNPNFGNAKYEDMIAALYELQEKWGVGIIDFYNFENMEELEESTLVSYMWEDRIHPREEGYRWMGEVMGGYLIASTKALPVKEMISALPESVTIKDENKVISARAAFEALTDVQKSTLSDGLLEKLSAAEALMESIKKNRASNTLIIIIAAVAIVVILVIIMLVRISKRKKASKISDN